VVCRSGLRAFSAGGFVKKKPVKLYIGSCIWDFEEKSDNKTINAIDKKEKALPNLVPIGACMADEKRILIRAGINGQDRFDAIIHEGIHAVSSEYLHNEALNHLFFNEDAVHILTKGIISYMNQLYAQKVIGE